MKRIAWLTLIGLIVLVGTASAAFVEISAPSTVYVGEPLVVTGTTAVEGLSRPTIEAGFSTDLIFYYAQYTKREVGRETIVVQQDGSFSATFPTAGLSGGQYTLEIVDPTTTTFGGSSITRLFVTLVDRSGNVTVSSPLTQEFDGALDIAGKISAGTSGVQIRVFQSTVTVAGPEAIRPDENGAFATSVAIPAGGTYLVTFSDSKGFIRNAEFLVTGGQSTPTPTAAPETISASAPASRASPAYFAVDTRSGTVTITTSTGIDWVVEYIDEDGDSHKVNSKGINDAEVLEFPAEGGVVYVKVYPISSSDSGTVRLTATNAETIQVSQEAPGIFGDASPTSTPAAGLPAMLALLALGLFILARRG
jgi:hypothetical protein